MEGNLTIRYDVEADILSVDVVPPYPGQEEDLIGDDVVARINPTTGRVESLEIQHFRTRLQPGESLAIPIRPDFTVDWAVVESWSPATVKRPSRAAS